MTDAIELARKVFTLFQAVYERFRARPGVTWTTAPLAEDGLSLSLTIEERGIGLNVLVEKGLVRQKTSTGYELTQQGREACLHPELVDSYLRPPQVFPAAAQPAPHVTISGGNVQIGHHNTQNVTYRALLQAALETVEEHDDVPAPVAGALRKLMEFPDLEALLSDAERKVRGA